MCYSIRVPVGQYHVGQVANRTKAVMGIGKGKGSPYSITKRRVPELIPVLGSQPAGAVSR